MSKNYIINDVEKEIYELYEKLTSRQKDDMSKFANAWEQASGIFGCPQLLIIYNQAWFLINGFKLKYCKAKTAEELLNTTTDSILRLHKEIKKHEETNS